MKKILAIFLALITILSIALVSCTNGGTTGNNGDDNGDDGLVAGDNNGGTNDTPGNNDLPGGNDTPGGDNTTPSPNNSEVAIETTVYPITDMKIRKDSINSETTKVVTRGTALSAVAVIKNAKGESIWYKLSYDNGTYYADADYVTTSLEKATFTDLATPLTIKVKAHGQNENPYGVNLRKFPSFDADLSTVTVKKEHTDVNAITATKVNGTGDWYYVTYNGENYYLAVTSATKNYLEGLPNGGNTGSDLPG
jgi:hypothetical protein